MAGMNGGSDRDDDLAREIRTHLELEAEERIADGSPPEDAHYAALRAFGNVTRVREEARAIWQWPWVAQVGQDARYAVRMLARSPGFSAVAVLTLALGIGATTAIFSVVHAVLLRPLPFSDSDRVVRIFENIATADGAAGGRRRVSPLVASDVAALRSKATSLSHAGVQIPTIRTITSRDEPVRLIGVRLSPDLLMMTGTKPLMGRVFASHEDAPGAGAVVILSHATWHRYFGGEPDIIGRIVGLDGKPHTVVGLMGPGFSFPGPEDEFWMPLEMTGPLMRQRLPITARLRDGVSMAAARAEIGTIVPGLRGESPVGPAAAGDSQAFELVPLLDLVVSPVKPALLVLSVAVGFVLLIACANVTNLLLARTAARQREFAVRHALGAGRGRLFRQALTESMLLAVAGGIGGTALAFGGVALLRALGTSLPRRDLGAGLNIPRVDEIGIDGSVLLFTVVVAGLTGVVLGLMPAIGHSRRQPVDVLRPDAASRISGFNLFGRYRLQGLLIVAEIGMALILFVGGGLLIHSFVRLVQVNPGYDPRDVLTFQLSLPAGRPDQELMALAEDLVGRVRGLPGVRAVGYAESLPMTRVSARFTQLRTTPDTTAPTRPPRMPPSFSPDSPDTRLVSRDYLAAMGIPVIAGRSFGNDDRSGHPPVMLINRTLARSRFPGENPLGKRLYALGRTPWEVVGIVEDVLQSSLTEPASPQIFIDVRQVPASEPLAGVGLYFGIRSDGAPTAIASNLRVISHQLDRQLIVENVAPMDALVSNSIARPRLYAMLLGIFAGVAVVLAAVGIYGVMSYAVTQRTPEIGVRMALGASHTQVMRLVLGQSLVLTATGLLVGLGGAAAVTRYLDQLLFGLTALDPLTFAGVSLLFATIAALAAFIPARRAVRVDPLIALRFE